MTGPAITLSDLCDFASAQVAPQDFAESPYLGLEHLASGRFLPVAQGKASDVQSSKLRFEKGDVLYGKLRPYLDKAVLAQSAGVCTTELLVLRPKPGVDGRFLASVVHAPAFVRHAMSGVTGAHHPRTSWSHIREFEVQPFSPKEQEKVADLVWATHSQLIHCERSLSALDRVKAASMRELFTRGLGGEAQKELQFGSVPESWRERPLDSVSEVQTGAAKGRKFGNAEAIEVPYLRVANVQDGHLDLAEMKTLRIRKSEVERYRLRNNDVVLTEGGDFDKLGRGFIWRDELPLCVHQNHVFAVRTDPDVLLPEFFAYLAQSPYGKAYFLQVAHKTTNLACINSTKLKAFPVVLPEPGEQQQIAETLAAIDQKIELHKKKRSVLDALLQSLLHKLMTGEVSVGALDLGALSGLSGARALSKG